MPVSTSTRDAVSKALFAVNLSGAIADQRTSFDEVIQQDSIGHIQSCEVPVVRHEGRRVGGRSCQGHLGRR